MEKFPISLWIYKGLDDIGPEAVDEWAECGATAPMSPMTRYGRDDLSRLIPYLDVAEKRGITLIAFVEGLMYSDCYNIGEDEYRKRFTEVYNIIKHPALFGFFVGDEPSSKENFEGAVTAIRIQKEVAPELTPYVNFHTCMDDTDPEVLGGKQFRPWLKDFVDNAGLKCFSYGHYDQVWNEDGEDSFFRNIKPLVEAAEQTGSECWNTQLSSPHYMFHTPTYYEMLWQITCAAACGSRGVTWFRYYDKKCAPNYHNSPIDEYGYKTPLYYDMLRANRRFNDNYGELIMKLHHKETYFTRRTMGTYPLFTERCHPVLKAVFSTERAIVSFFRDDDDREYLVIVNESMEKAGVFKFAFDRSRYRFVEMMDNGKDESGEYNDERSLAHWDGLWLYPGQMMIYRIENKPTKGEESNRAVWGTNN